MTITAAILSSHDIYGPEKQKCVKSSFIIFEIIRNFSCNFKILQMQIVVSTNTVPL
jgi:hypothetical protein